MIFLLLIFIILLGIRVKKVGFYEDYLSKNNTMQLRGILALVVIFHHIEQRVNSGLFFHVFSYVGYLVVALFFFITGYGLMTQYITQKDYLKNFIKLRIPTITIPYLIVMVIYYFAFKIVEKKITIIGALESLINGNPIVSSSWYILVIILFYIFFYITGMFCKNNLTKLSILTTIELCVYVVLCFMLNYGFWYFNACFAFLLGIIWGIKSESIITFIHKYFNRILLFLILGFVLFFTIPKLLLLYVPNHIVYEISLLICYQISSMLFCLFVIILNQKVHFTNVFFNKIGRISFEIYMIHGLFILLLRNNEWYFKSDIVFTVIVIVGSILAAKLLYAVDRYLLSKYFAFLKC